MSNSSQSDQLKRLNRIEGQIKGIKKMVEEERFPVDILIQSKAVISAMKKVEHKILHDYISDSLIDSSNQKNSSEMKSKINEILNVLDKRI